MIKQHEVTMDNNDKTDMIVTVRVIVEGLERNEAILLAEERFPNFKTRYVIAGHRQEASK